MKRLFSFAAMVMSVLIIGGAMTACNLNGSGSTAETDFKVSYCNMNARTKGDLEEGSFNRKIVSFESWVELTKSLPEGIPTYSSDYFDHNSLIVCIGKSGTGGAELQNVRLSIDNDVATVTVNAKNGILTVVTDWVLILEISGNKLENVNTIEVKADFQ